MLKLEQLSHEVEIRRDDVALGFDKLVSLQHGQRRSIHDEGDEDGGGSGDAGLTVDENRRFRPQRLVDEAEGLEEILRQVLRGVI